MEQWEIEQVHQERLYNFYFDELGFCGCGRPDFVLGLIKNLLNAIKEKTEKQQVKDYNHKEVYNNHQDKLKSIFEFKEQEDNEFSESQDGVVYFVLYHLDNIDILEHGGSIGGAWLTEYGVQILESLNYFDDLEHII